MLIHFVVYWIHVIGELIEYVDIFSAYNKVSWCMSEILLVNPYSLFCDFLFENFIIISRLIILITHHPTIIRSPLVKMFHSLFLLNLVISLDVNFTFVSGKRDAFHQSNLTSLLIAYLVYIFRTIIPVHRLLFPNVIYSGIYYITSDVFLLTLWFPEIYQTCNHCLCPIFPFVVWFL